ncbi:hypothetical protein [Aquimarina aquimarini]|uniref:hypothetical protein n=1 Tax=Aquimarina aquimarini TaxID=1191734 RepID=UPI001F2D8806|nr:hypothetical protein [Aquimarina aquimarini]
MKIQLIIITIYFILIAACNSTQQFVINDTDCNLHIDLTENEKKINIKQYDSILSQKGNIVKSNNKYETSITKYPEGYKFLYGYKQTNKQTNIGKWIDYYPNGSIYKIQFVYEKGFQYLDKETHYDLQGNITKVIDHRQADKYPICYKEALKITEGLKRKRDSIFAITRDSLVTDVKKTYVWKVFIDEPQDPEVTQHAKSWCYVINAQTGKLIKKIKVTANPG